MTSAQRLCYCIRLLSVKQAWPLSLHILIKIEWSKQKRVIFLIKQACDKLKCEDLEEAYLG